MKQHLGQQYLYRISRAGMEVSSQQLEYGLCSSAQLMKPIGFISFINMQLRQASYYGGRVYVSTEKRGVLDIIWSHSLRCLRTDSLKEALANGLKLSNCVVTHQVG